MVAQADLPFETVCVTGLQPVDLKQIGSVGWYILLVHLRELGVPARARVSHPDLIQTVETNSRVRPAFELDVDSLGGTRICALLVRGTVTSGSLGTTLQ